MPEPRRLLFTEPWALRIQEAVRAVERQPWYFGGRKSPGGRTPDASWDLRVAITSTTPVDGRYPGTWFSYNAATKVYTSGVTCWVVDANGRALTTGVYYRARLVGALSTGVPVYETVEPAEPPAPPGIFQGARVYNTTNLSIANATPTVLTFDSERWDTNNYHDVSSNTNRLTFPEDGDYIVGISISWEASAGGTYRRLRILDNAGNILAGASAPSLGAGSTVEQTLTTLVERISGSPAYVEAQVAQDSGGNLNVLASARYSPEFWVRHWATD